MRAGEALDSVQFALSEVSAVDMPKAAGRPIEEVGLEYLTGWRDRGFDITMCFQQADCFTGQKMTPQQAVHATVTGGIINVLFQKSSPADGDGDGDGEEAGPMVAAAPGQSPVPAGVELEAGGVDIPESEALELDGAAGVAPDGAEEAMDTPLVAVDAAVAARPLTGDSCVIDRNLPSAPAPLACLPPSVSRPSGGRL